MVSLWLYDDPGRIVSKSSAEAIVDDDFSQKAIGALGME